MSKPLTLLGIETSCDETAAAVLRFEDGKATLLSDVIRTQLAEHAPYLGVVPEIAARAHAELADLTVAAAMNASGLKYADLDGVAATAGPGLIGGVLVGLMTGKAIAQAAGKPFIPVNHLEGHALSPRLSEDCPFPYLLLLVSGGHCQFLEVRGLGDYRRLGSTIDDAAGEAFDKVAKLLGLGFPGGPAVEKMAASGNPKAHDFPRPLLGRPGLEMSFAGLKTAIARASEGARTDQEKADICASFQAAICDVLAEKTRRALAGFDADADEKRFVVAGGVASNKAIRAALEAAASANGARLIAPPLRHCTDNAAMIALAGAERLAAGKDAEGLASGARPRWPLDEASAKADPVFGAGRRGAKA
ncbi:tRNA (adenosine(37)-N6)-threonylcarbamoyltransferase complex transferase subunit TsaD [Hyphomonas sediminis]|uniref:tRNA (adenosine(37)-N6)-threonylcarbamoyltransferase complex transferase subunit TsaD n=1 Tax=Hyphomonas sediminis TaxID=2866160 RepID=UPI001CED0B0D|nr:tRNA (adenosine(37)-N6)-threonylcarbamoyltransferase complex transferase subunit TsaD [Hyphomonas sediminis]